MGQEQRYDFLAKDPEGFHQQDLQRFSFGTASYLITWAGIQLASTARLQQI
jgi:hypothetical protein